MSAKTDFDPSGVANKNGGFMGLDIDPKDAEMILFSIPWDVTTSYRPGTARGPQSIIEASYQLDFHTPHLERAWEMQLATLPLAEEWFERSAKVRKESERYIGFLEDGGNASENPEMLAILERANKASEDLHKWSLEQSRHWLKQGKRLLTIGGDHSVSLGPIQAHAEKYPGLSVLHFDAHADLRVAYEGFSHSHASIMDQVMHFPGVAKLVQVGIRDVSPDEVARIKSDPRIDTFFDWELKANMYRGVTWHEQCEQIISKLGKDVYISFDIDGLDPKLCPNTGTPVPGGIELEHAVYLVHLLGKSGRKLIGADLVEVAPGPDGNQWDGNVGARMLFQLCVAVAASLRVK
jgi:agmatinase